MKIKEQTRKLAAGCSKHCFEVVDKTVTAAEYEKAKEKWLKEKEESNKKAQEELAKHVK